MAGVIRPGDVVALTGELGAGKTRFVQGAAAALGVVDRVTSPSFILRKEYRGTDVAIVHLDVYRLESLQEVVDLGFGEPGDDRAVSFVEWGDAMSPLLPADHLEVDLRLPPLEGDALHAAPDAGAGLEPRTITLVPHGPDWSRRLVGLRPSLDAWATPGGPAC